MSVIWSLFLVVFVALVVAALSLGYVPFGVIAIASVGFLLVSRLGTALANEHDRAWLPRLLPAAFVAKLFGVFARYYMVTGLYGRGDSLGYHRAAQELAPVWRSLQVPAGTRGSPSTRFTEVVTSIFYIPGDPSLFGGFLIFGTLAFIGSICFYLAFRRRLPVAGLRTYALILFFLPSLLFWPSSIGKDALMLLALGVAALGAAFVFEGRYITGAMVVVPSLTFAAAIRPHVAAMLVSALVFALVLAKGLGRMTGLGRFVVLAASIVALFSLATVAMNDLGIEDTTEGLEEFLGEQERLTGQGGSAVTGSPVSNPFDLPEATLRVLFRPLPHEAHNIGALLSAVEGTFLLGIAVWRFPYLWRNLKVVRKYPYLLFSLIYTGAFVVAFSALFNLGILARQRIQVLPLFLALLIGLGWQGSRKLDLARAAGRDRQPSVLAGARAEPNA